MSRDADPSALLHANEANERFSVQALRATFYERTDQILQDTQKRLQYLGGVSAGCMPAPPMFLLAPIADLAHVLCFPEGAVAARAQASTSKVPVVSSALPGVLSELHPLSFRGLHIPIQVSRQPGSESRITRASGVHGIRRA